MKQKNSDKPNQYPEYDQLHLPTIEKAILQWWEANGVFEKSVSTRPADKPFVFYEGPPSANGKPGIHHVLSRTIKDLFCRFKTLQGYRVERKAGWDTHGLPVELGVEKQLGITKADIGTKITVAEYNKLCREDVMKFTDTWNELTRKMGYWVDMQNPYITFENKYIESLWALLKMLYEKNLLYEGYTIQPYSPAAGTGLSSHELNQPGCYRNVKDRTATVMFQLDENSSTDFARKHLANEDVHGTINLLAWTTTPWTLPSNTALAVGEEIDYAIINTYNPFSEYPVTVIMAKELTDKYFNPENEKIPLEEFGVGVTDKKKIPHKIVGVIKGKELIGYTYVQLLPFAQPKGDAFKILPGDFVTTSDGTGVVHIAPSFGSDDFRVARQHNIASLTLVDRQGKFLNEVSDGIFLYGREYVKEDYLTDDEKQSAFQKQKQILEANGRIKELKQYLSVDERIVLRLQEEGMLFKKEMYEHSYPHCWRTDKPVIYYPLDSWFVRTTAVKARLIELNKTINWKPAHTGEGRFGQWLENLVDWNLSRSRYWGTPLPIWTTDSGAEVKCIGSIAELKTEIEKAVKAGVSKPIEVTDLHKPVVDDIILVSDAGKPMKRVADLIDVWFDSGAMPYAQWHWLPGPQTPEGGLNETASEQLLRWKTANPLKYEQIKLLARENRNKPTEAEEILWTQLSGKKLKGYKFRRQHIIDDTIVDFVCLEKKLVIEVDGGYHNSEEQQKADKARTEYLACLHYKVIRFTNEEVISYTDVILNTILKELAARPTLPKGAVVSPPFGGGGGSFPADFIAEGVDQTRGWFFTLHVLAVALFDTVAYKNVVSNGLLLDKSGNKMSKRLGNVIDPFETIDKFSADATRWYMMRNSDPWENMKFDMNGLQDVIRSHFGTLYNTYGFFALYANIDSWKIDEKNFVPVAKRPELDRWIISKLQSLINEVTLCYEAYEPTKAARAIEKFVDEDLSNWYVRLNRRRFWKGDMSEDKQAAYETLHESLSTVAQLMSPVAPFFSDWLFRNLNDGDSSVHLSYLPAANESLVDNDLEERMDLAQHACSLILSLRKKEKIKVRQPLSKVLIPVLTQKMKAQISKVENYILNEVNVKEVQYVDDASGIVKKKIKPNFKELGKRAGTKMKSIQTAVNAFLPDDIAQIEREQRYPLLLEGESFELLLSDVEILTEDIPGWLVASESGITVALDVNITDELRNEGNAREFVNKVQNLRKEKDYLVTDRISVQVLRNRTFEKTLQQWQPYMSSELLANAISVTDSLETYDEIEINDEVLKVKVAIA